MRRPDQSLNTAEAPSVNRRRMLAAATASALFGGQQSSATGASVPARPHRASRPAVALVLGGGGCRGYGHIGFLKGLEERGLRPDLVIGASVGSLVGALYAAGIHPLQLERIGGQMSTNTFRNWVFPRLGVFGGGRIAEFVRIHVKVQAIEALPIRFAAVATDLQSGREVVFDRGDLGVAVQASTSLPGLIEPVRINGRHYVDGNISSPVPVAIARGLGAERVVAVDVTFPPEQADLRDPFDALYQAFSILTRRLAIEDRRKADLAIEPPIPVHNDMSPATLAAVVAAGRDAAIDAMPALERLFSVSM